MVGGTGHFWHSSPHLASLFVRRVHHHLRGNVTDLLDFLYLFDLLLDEASEVTVRGGLSRIGVLCAIVVRVQKDGSFLGQAVFGALGLAMHSLGCLGKLDGGEGCFLWLLVDRGWL